MMRFKEDWLELIVLPKNEEEMKIVDYFRRGLVKFRFNPEKQMLEVYPRIFKVKFLDFILKFEKREEDEALTIYQKAFLNLWKEGKFSSWL